MPSRVNVSVQIQRATDAITGRPSSASQSFTSVSETQPEARFHDFEYEAASWHHVSAVTMATACLATLQRVLCILPVTIKEAPLTEDLNGREHVTHHSCK